MHIAVSILSKLNQSALSVIWWAIIYPVLGFSHYSKSFSGSLGGGGGLAHWSVCRLMCSNAFDSTHLEKLLSSLRLSTYSLWNEQPSLTVYRGHCSHDNNPLSFWKTVLSSPMQAVIKALVFSGGLCMNEKGRLDFFAKHPQICSPCGGL